MYGRQWTLCLTVAAVGTACGWSPPAAKEDAGVDAGPVIVQPTLSDIQAKIFTPTCATSGCHSGSTVTNSNGLNLSAGESYSNLVSIPSYAKPGEDRVDPGNPNPNMSYLMLKITAPTDPNALNSWESTYGLPMPNGGSPLPQEQVNAISTWIMNGAPND